MPVSYLVIDLETTVRNNKIGKNKASPFYPDNKIVLGAAISDGTKKPFDLNTKWYYSRGNPLTFIVGQNIAFDLHYLRKENPKLMEIIDWHWFLVLLPFIVQVAIPIILLLVTGGLFIIGKLLERDKGSAR